MNKERKLKVHYSYVHVENTCITTS